jgi:hypothetical protein
MNRDLYGIYIAAAQIRPRIYMPDGRCTRCIAGDCPMLDAIFVAAGFGMFFLGVMYVFACDRL